MVRSRFVQIILDEVYRRGVVKKEVLVDVVAERLGIERKKADDALGVVLRRLVRKGLIARKGRGYYAKP
jgi:predicted transcriptional regulator